MWTEQLKTTSDEQEDLDFKERQKAQEWLKYIKDELYQGNEHQVNYELLNTANSINTLLQQQIEKWEIGIDRYTELADLMRSVVEKVQQAAKWTDLYAKNFNLAEEKRLLLELMWSILAKIWRQQEAAKVIQFSEEAISFYNAIGLGWLYQILLWKAL